MSAATKRRTVRGQCSGCGVEYALRVDGTVRYHAAGVNPVCAGSLRPPLPHVHRCDCGARWDEEVDA